MFLEKYHIEFGTRKLVFSHEKMYGVKKQLFQVLCAARFAPESAVLHSEMLKLLFSATLSIHFYDLKGSI